MDVVVSPRAMMEATLPKAAARDSQLTDPTRRPLQTVSDLHPGNYSFRKRGIGLPAHLAYPPIGLALERDSFEVYSQLKSSVLTPQRVHPLPRKSLLSAAVGQASPPPPKNSGANTR